MKKIKFGRLFLRNFKSFAKSIEFDFSKQDLFILDGPNGFGKTTVFDAIELCFVNEISRLLQTDTKQKETHYLKNNKDEITVICLELLDEEKTYAIYVEIPKSGSNSDNKISAKNYSSKLLKEYPDKGILENIPFNISVIDNITVHETLSELIDNERLKETFSIFHYIQQEETTHFLKNNEKDRHGIINYLLGTKEERTQQDKIKSIKKFITEKLGDIQKEITDLIKSLQDESLNNINNFDRFLNEIPKGVEKFSYIYNITDHAELPYESLDLFSANLVRIEWLKQNIETYKKLQLDSYIDTLIIERDDLILNLLYVWNIYSYDEIKKNSDYYTKVVRARNRIHLFEQKIPEFEILLNSNLKRKDLENLFFSLKPVFIDLEVKLLGFKNELQNLENLENESNSHQRIIEMIDLSRKNLLDKYQEFVEHNHMEEINCPLCGIEKESLKVLFEEYDKQSDIFNQLKNKSDFDKIELSKKLKKRLMIPYVKSMKRYIKWTRKGLIPSAVEAYLQNQIISEAVWDRTQKLKKWLSTNNILLLDEIFNKENIASEMSRDSDNVVRIFKDRIKQYKTLPESQYTFDQIQASLKGLKLEFTERLELLDIASKQEILQNDLEIELEYINFLISSKRYLENNNKRIKIAELRSQFDFYNQYGKQKIGFLDEINNIYKKQIKDFEKQVVKNISIPFYIYSSKTLQTRIDGNGVFIDTAPIGKENNFLRFSYSAKSDHDAWNTMSSGQLSGVVITFMLAMNKMYPSNLKTLLIDDPVQTMDEINMVSLLQLLRYEFSDYQFIMSTHEKSISNYFSYKYSALGKSVKPLDIKSYRFQEIGT